MSTWTPTIVEYFATAHASTARPSTTTTAAPAPVHYGSHR